MQIGQPRKGLILRHKKLTTRANSAAKATNVPVKIKYKEKKLLLPYPVLKCMFLKICVFPIRTYCTYRDDTPHNSQKECLQIA